MTGLVYDERMLQHKHEWLPGEQESPVRMQRAYERCSQEGLVARCTIVPARHIAEADLNLVHGREYVQLIKKSRNFTRPELYNLSGQFDGVFFNEWTWTCASLAAGSLQHVTRLVASGQLANGLALLRPPGHHAMHSEACGYCVFSNVAVAAASLLQPPPRSVLHDTAGAGSSPAPSLHGEQKRAASPALVLDRILIVDWDVHHGQGTQYAFYNDKRVLFISIHRHENSRFWPNLREADYDFVGASEARGYNINIPLNDTGMCDSDYLAIFHNLLMPIALEFDPQLVIVSCGFDAAIGCPEGRMWLSPAVFGHFVHHLKMLAGGKLVINLEGGYYVDSLAEGVVHVLKALLGDPVTPIHLTRPPCKSIRRTIDSCVTALRGYWKSLRIPGVSRIMDRPNITHMSPFTWPLVRRVVWPDTNPLMPVELREHVERLLREYLPGPVTLASQGTLLLLLPVFPLAGTMVGKVKRSRHPAETTSAWSKSLLLSLSKLMDINFFLREQNSGSQNQIAGKFCSSAMQETGSVSKQKRTITTSSACKSPGRGQQSKKGRKRSHSQLAPDATDVTRDTQQNGSITEQRPSMHVTSSRWDPGKAMQTTHVDFQDAIRQALKDLLLLRFSRLLVFTDRLDLASLLSAVSSLPVHLLATHRQDMLRPRAEPRASSCTAATTTSDLATLRGGTVQTMSLLSGGCAQPKEQRRLARQLDQLREMAQQCKSMLDSVSLPASSLAECNSESQCLPSGHRPNVIRLFVVDLTGSQQLWASEEGTSAKEPGDAGGGGGGGKASDGEMHCDVTWCSVGQAKASNVPIDSRTSDTGLRALPLRPSLGSSTRGHVLRGGHWLRVPLSGATQCNRLRGEATEVPMVADLVAVVLHLLLPMAYEYAPDLVCLQVHSDWLDRRAPIAVGVAHVLHLLNGLGAPVLVNCCHRSSSKEPPPTPASLLLDVLLGRPQLPNVGSLCPSERVQALLRSAMLANSNRWKCLKFAGNLVEWR